MDNKTKSELLTPDHKCWKTFCSRLKYMLNKTGKCDGYTHSWKILKDFTDINDIETILYFEENGGFCDCEIIMNIADMWEEEI